MKVTPLLLAASFLAIAITSSLAATTFNQLDKDKNGYITSEEVIAYFDGYHKNGLDQNKDGVISIEEWPTNPGAFRAIDTDKNGELSFEDLDRWRVQTIITSKDKDKDGQVDFEEYDAQ